MKSEKEMLEHMLKGVGIEVELNDDVKPTKHPSIVALEKYLDDGGVEFMHFEDTDTIAIIDCKSEILKNSVVMPTPEGYSVLVMCKRVDDTDDFLDEVTKALEDTMPPDAFYNVVGVM